MSNFLESYMIRIGADIDESSFRKLDSMMEKAEKTITVHTGGMVKRLLEGQFAIVGAFTSISAAILGVVEHVSMADQSYRLMGLRMMMTGEQARKMSMITKALGASMEEIIWDPELHARAVAMSADIDKMTAGLGPNFEGSMRSIRDFRNEFSRLGVAAQFLGMAFVNDLWAKLNPGAAGKSLEQWVDWFETKIPELADKLSTYAIPALEGTWSIVKSLGGVVEHAAIAFTNMVGVLSGDSSIEGTALSFDKVAKAIEHVGEGMVLFFDWFAKGEKSLAEFASAAGLMMSGKYSEAADELKRAQKDFVGLGDFVAEQRQKKKDSDDRWNKGEALGGKDTLTGAALGMMLQSQGADRDRAISDMVTRYAAEHPVDAAMAGRTKALPLLGPRTGAVGGAVLGSTLLGPGVGTVVGAGIGGTAGILNQAIDETGDRPTDAQKTWRWFQDQIGQDFSMKKNGQQAKTQAPASSPTAAAVSRGDNTDLVEKFATAIAKVEAGNKPNPISERNNNPGNLRSWKGVPTEGGYAKFPTRDQGMEALREQVQRNFDRGLTTKEFFAGKKDYPGYAPEKDNNRPDKYAATVAKDLGIDQNTPLNQLQKSAPKEQSWPSIVLTPTPDSKSISPISYTQPRASNSTFDRNWGVIAASMDRPVAPSPNISNSQHSTHVEVGGITIVNPGMDEHKVQRAVTDGIQEAMFHQTQLDITQLSPAFA